MTTSLTQVAVRLLTRRRCSPIPAQLDLPAAPATHRAWAAGIVEGEGTIAIRYATGRSRPQLLVSIMNTDRDMLDAFPKYWAGRVLESRHVTLNPRHKRSYRWVIVSQQAARFIRDIQPFLVTPRVRIKADLALRFQAYKDAWRTQPGMDGEHYTARQLVFFNEMRVLNQRGNVHVGDNAEA